MYGSARHRHASAARSFRRLLGAAIALPGLLVLVPVAAADPAATLPAAQHTVPPFPVDQHVFGDWGGLLETLANDGIAPSASYLSESSANVSGGKRTGVDYADQRALGLDVDWQKLAGLPGFTTHFLLVNRGGRGVGSDYVGDGLYNENEIYGGAGNVAVHLAYVYGVESLLDGRLKIGGGRLSEGLFFNSSPIYCSFLSFALCPAARSLTGGSDGAFTMSPANEWGAYAKAEPTSQTYVQLGVFEAGGTHGGRSGFSWSDDGASGVTIPAELGWERSGPMSAHLKAGAYYTSAHAPDVYLDVNHDPMALTGNPAYERRGYFGVWVAADAMVVKHGDAASDGLVAFANYTHTDPHVSVFSDLAFVGLEDSGLIASRPHDSFGAQFTYSHQSNYLKDAEELDNQIAILSDGEPVYPQTHQMVLETQYDAHVFNGIDLQPDIQYVIRPNATRQYDNAVVLGVRLIISL